MRLLQNTIGHSFHRPTRRFAVCIALALCTLATTSSATDQRFPVNHENPTASVPDENERKGAALEFGYWLMEVSAAGDEALKANDFAKAAKYFEALAVAVPERAVPFSKLCSAYQALGDTERALENCRQAVGLEGTTVGDTTRLIGLMTGGPGPLPPESLAQLDGLVEHLRAVNVVPSLVAEQECLVAEKLRSAERLRKCIGHLELAGQSGGRLTAFRWRLAMLEGKIAEAERLVGVARKDPAFSPEAIRHLAAETDALRQPARLLKLVLGLGLGTLSGLAGLFVWWRKRDQRPRALALAA